MLPPPGTPPQSPAGAPYGKRLSAVRIEFASGFGTAEVGFAVPISPHSPGPAVTSSVQGPAATSAAGAPYGKRLSAVRIEFANGFGTAKAGFAVPISPRSPGSSSHFRNPGPSSHFRSPGPSNHFRQPGSSSHFRSQGPRAKATQYRKRGRFCTAGFCKRATGPYLCRSRRR